MAELLFGSLFVLIIFGSAVVTGCYNVQCDTQDKSIQHYVDVMPCLEVTLLM